MLLSGYLRISSSWPIKLAVLSNLLFLLTPCAASNTPQFINFPDAIHLALNANPRINESSAKVDAAQAAIKETRGHALPELGVEENVSASNNPLNVFGYRLSQGQVSFADFGFAEFTGPSSLNVVPAALNSPGYYDNFDTGIVLNIPIFAGGANWAKIKRAKALLQAAQEGNQQAKSQLIYDVLQAYEGAHTTAQLVSTAQQSLAAANSYLKLTQSLYKQSLVLQSDVLLAETNVRSAQATVTATIAENKNQLDTFRILIGQPNSRLMPGQTVYFPLPKEPTDTLEQHALLSNTQLLAHKALVEANRDNIRSASASNWPQLNLQLRHDWNAQTPELSSPSNTVLLEMNWALFSSGAQEGSTQYAMAAYKESSAELDDMYNNIRLSTLKTVRAIQTAETQITTSDLNARQSKEMIQILKTKYGQGVIPLGQLLEGQSRLDTAKAQQIMARYNLLLTQAKLLMLTNELAAYSEKTQYE